MIREEFMDIVYSELYSDGDNYRANRIIDAADEYEETERKSVLDKIRAEIDVETRVQVRHYTNTNAVIDAVLDVIDKYKAESEE